MICFENVSKTYQTGTVALRDLSVDIEKGEFVFLVGTTGSGKTTFIRLAAPGGAPRRGSDLGCRARGGAPERVARSRSEAQHRLCVPGLQASAEQDRVRERRVRAPRS